VQFSGFAGALKLWHGDKRTKGMDMLIESDVP